MAIKKNTRMELTFDFLELREVRAGLKLREAELKTVRKKADDAGLSTADMDNHLSILRGGDETPGLLYQVQEQLDAIFEAPEAGAQLELHADDSEADSPAEEEAVGPGNPEDGVKLLGQDGAEIGPHGEVPGPALSDISPATKIPMVCLGCGFEEEITEEQADSEMVIPCTKCQEPLEVNTGAMG